MRSIMTMGHVVAELRLLDTGDAIVDQVIDILYVHVRILNHLDCRSIARGALSSA